MAFSGRVGVVFPGAGDSPSAWSGVPRGLADGIAATGTDVTHVSAGRLTRAERAIARLARLAEGGSLKASLRSRALARELGRTLACAAYVQIGSTFELPAGLRYVTFEDMTVAQAEVLGHFEGAGLSGRDLAAWRGRQPRIYEGATACCVASRWAADSLVHDYGVPLAKVHVVGFGRNHTPKVDKRDWARARFLFVGNDWERKGGPAVVRAFTALRSELADIRLDLVGSHPADLPDGVRGHGRLRLDVPGERAELDRLFALATCFVMPSRYEPFGIVYTEASAAGISSIGTSVGGAGDVIADAGRLVEPGDHETLLAAMRELAHPATAAELGWRARARGEHFSWRAVAERVLGAAAA